MLKTIVQRLIGLFATCLLISCVTPPPTPIAPSKPKDGPPTYPRDVSMIPDAIPKITKKSHYGNPDSYVVNGRRYFVMDSNKNYHATGIASWYGIKFQDHLTSNGELYSMYKMTAAHRTLPIPTYLRVTNLKNGRRVIVRVNDRGPFENNRLIDLSYAAAEKLGIVAKGTGLVEVDVINPSRVKTTSTRTIHLAKNKNPNIYLQVGAYSDYDHATSMQKRIDTATLAPVHIYTGEFNHHPLYHVQVGPIADVETADQVSKEIERAGLPEPMTVIKEEAKA